MLCKSLIVLTALVGVAFAHYGVRDEWDGNTRGRGDIYWYGGRGDGYGGRGRGDGYGAGRGRGDGYGGRGDGYGGRGRGYGGFFYQNHNHGQLFPSGSGTSFFDFGSLLNPSGSGILFGQQPSGRPAVTQPTSRPTQPATRPTAIVPQPSVPSQLGLPIAVPPRPPAGPAIP